MRPVTDDPLPFGQRGARQEVRVPARALLAYLDVGMKRHPLTVEISIVLGLWLGGVTPLWALNLRDCARAAPFADRWP